MSESKFYLLALYAMKLNPDDVVYTSEEDGSIKWDFKPGKKTMGEGFPLVSLWALGAVAQSADEAKAQGMEKLMEVCPSQQGWVNHHVSINTVSRATLLRVVEDATGTSERTEDDEWPDILM
jgi:hypothetical protein